MKSQLFIISFILISSMICAGNRAFYMNSINSSIYQKCPTLIAQQFLLVYAKKYSNPLLVNKWISEMDKSLLEESRSCKEAIHQALGAFLNK